MAPVGVALVGPLLVGSLLGGSVLVDVVAVGGVALVGPLLVGSLLGGSVLVDVVAVGGAPLGVLAPAPVDDGVGAEDVPRCFGLGALNLCLFRLGALGLGTVCAVLVEGPTTAIRSPLLTADDRDGDDVARSFETRSRAPDW